MNLKIGKEYITKSGNRAKIYAIYPDQEVDAIQGSVLYTTGVWHQVDWNINGLQNHIIIHDDSLTEKEYISEETFEEKVLKELSEIKDLIKLNNLPISQSSTTKITFTPCPDGCSYPPYWSGTLSPNCLRCGRTKSTINTFTVNNALSGDGGTYEY